MARLLDARTRIENLSCPHRTPRPRRIEQTPRDVKWVPIQESRLDLHRTQRWRLSKRSISRKPMTGAVFNIALYAL